MNSVIDVKRELGELLKASVSRAQAAGKLPAIPLPSIQIEHPQKSEHGDYATSLPLRMARAAAMNPMQIAVEIVAYITKPAEVNAIDVAAPGFINFTLSPEWLTSQVDAIIAAGEEYAALDIGQGSRVQLEFVSVNPTGPLHVGHGRGAVLGSALASVLSACGYEVEKEYYINDAGSQMDAFARSIYARYCQRFNKNVVIPENGYHGEYITELAKDIIKDKQSCFINLPEAEALSCIREIGMERMLGEIRRDLERLGVIFDVWFSEKTLYDEGQYDTVMSMLAEAGYITRRENATWFVSTALGEDKDNVVVRSDGSPTYFAADIAYHYNKFIERKFDRVINIWGADHQGHVPRMKAVVSALGIDPERLQVIISQMVTLKRGEEIVRISKRSGDMITLSDVIDEVGADACRFFFLARSADSQMDFDLELAKKESAENPVYYVQYAHARIASILHLAEEKNILYQDGDVSLLSSDAELALIRRMLLLPEIMELIASTMGPHHLPYYALELATVFHNFYQQCRVISDDVPLTKARLKLVAAAKQVLARALGLMGIMAPDNM